MINPKSYIAAAQGITNRINQDMPFAERMIREANKLIESAQGLLALHGSRDTTITEDAHFLKVQKAAVKLNEQVNKTVDASMAIEREASNDAQCRMDEKVNLKPGANAAEIRAIFRSMDDSKRADFLNRLVHMNKAPELAAIIEVGSELTAFILNDKLRASYREAILNMHAPKELKELEAAQEDVQSLRLVAKEIRKVADAFSDPYRLESIRRGKELADAVEAKLNANLGA